MTAARLPLIPKFALAVSLAGALALASGCGEGKAPLSPESTSLTQAPDGIIYLSFSPQALARLGKVAAIPEGGKTTSRLFYPDQTSSMKVQDLEGAGTRDDLEIEFRVPAGALNRPTKITMTVYGNKLSDLVLAFEPDGLVFNKPAQLKLKIGAERIDRSLLDLETLLLPFADLQAYHEHDGSVENAAITSVKTYIYALLLGEVESPLPLGVYDYARIEVSVPGFSRYGLSN
jgi:hypothetical protein